MKLWSMRAYKALEDDIRKKDVMTVAHTVTSCTNFAISTIHQRLWTGSGALSRQEAENSAVDSWPKVLRIDETEASQGKYQMGDEVQSEG